MSREPLVDRRILERLETLTLRWQKSFPGLVGGHNPSRFAGPGLEFFDHRHFHEGDDLRAVNWRAYLRLEKLFLKVFHVEPRIPVRLLIDVSLSMAVAGGGKFDYARKLAAALCYVGLVRLETMVLQPFSDRLGDHLVCSGGRHRFGPAAEFLSKLRPGGATSYFHTAREFLSRYPQRGLLVVLSDFLDDADCTAALQYLADFGHELLLVHVWEDQDRTPPWEGELEIVDSETGARLELDFDAGAREAYTRAFDAYAEELRALAARNHGRYVGIPVSLPFERAVFGSLGLVWGLG
ncbi:MAG: DUF58 domain-containing protein [Bryobacterales bacterium]|nr:DUF58 domain-containing protein [Bryobacteraceae bacterium]MDW8354459.1 DUF58 domain-containing protein [Bryobacterales bacterium]